jgi:hypothetical protein
MIVETFHYCSLSGPNFDPTPFLNQHQFKISRYHRIGDVGTTGTMKGRIWKSGHVLFESKKGDFDEFVQEVYSIKDLILESQTEERELHISLWYEAQCNWEFDPGISDMDFTLTITCAQT